MLSYIWSDSGNEYSKRWMPCLITKSFNTSLGTATNDYYSVGLSFIKHYGLLLSNTIDIQVYNIVNLEALALLTQSLYIIVEDNTLNVFSNPSVLL